MDPYRQETRILHLSHQPVDKLHLAFHYTRPPDYDFRAAVRTCNESFQVSNYHNHDKEIFLLCLFQAQLCNVPISWWVTLQHSRKVCAMDLIRGGCPMVTSDKLATDSTMSKSRSTAGNACRRNLQVSTKIAGTLQDQNKANHTSDWTALLRQMFMDDIFSHHICGPALANHLLVLVSQENLVQAVKEKCVST